MMIAVSVLSYLLNIFSLSLSLLLCGQIRGTVHFRKAEALHRVDHFTSAGTRTAPPTRALQRVEFPRRFVDGFPVPFR